MTLTELTQKHSETLDKAVQANISREYFAHWNESPSKKVYGETASEEGEAAFKASLHHKFTRLQQAGETGWHGEEESPFGFGLGVQYPTFTIEHLITSAHNAKKQWQRLSPTDRAVVLIEALERAGTGKTFFEIAYSTMHTAGQSFAMSFQASGPHSFDRALEALALGFSEQAQFVTEATWVKPAGAANITVKKNFHIVPKGIGLVIGCSTFPVWNTLPGLFASLVTGNPVIVKPHPKSVLAIAVVVASMQETFKDLGLDPHLVQLAADSSANPLTLTLSEHPAVNVIDFTGGAFGNTIEEIGRKHGKAVFTEKAGVNGVILESVENLDAVLDNLAFTLSLYSGQMCTTSQNFFINKHGVKEGDTVVPFDEVAQRFAAKIDALVNNPKMSAITGGIQSEITYKRVAEAKALGLKVVRDSQPVPQGGFDNARTASPLLLQADAAQHDKYEHEWFGPISFLIPTDGFDHSLHLLLRSLKHKGALTTLVYTTDAAQREQAEDAIIFEGKAPVAFNYVGGIFVNQSSAFSDFHGAGANPAGNASFADASFVTNRFNVIGAREVA
ncbi:MAG: phenylacetic acid degradation protein PaaN [Ignavibacteria bacterium]|nr:phenylacetic acid degradation protein PaaN [Ignavibacteria bacterium]MBL7990722.1 phenylacetic acid degradation protein PaaN [Candidatus Kapabacteria bacterium]